MKVRDWGKRVLTIDLLGELDKVWEGKGLAELCVDSRLC